MRRAHVNWYPFGLTGSGFVSTPWQEERSFFDRLIRKEKHHFVPKSLLRHFLEPEEWATVANRANHLRELDKATKQIGWKGIKPAGQVPQLNFAAQFSSERYWGLDDVALSEGARRLCKSADVGGAFLMTPGIAAMCLRAPSWKKALAAELVAGRYAEAPGKDEATRAVVVLADRVKRDWVTALDRGRVQIAVHRVRDGGDRLFVIGDVPVDVRDKNDRLVMRPAWLWEDEWFPEAGDEEPHDFLELTITMPIASNLALTITASSVQCDESSVEEKDATDEAVESMNRATAERACNYVWGGRQRDLKPLV